MTSQLSLSLADRHEGQAAVLAAATTAHRDDRHQAEAVLAELVRAGAPFTSEDVRRLAKLDDAAPNLMPSVIGVAAARRVIVPVGEYRSARRSRHASRNRVWIAANAVENNSAA